jgi:hypothetical protein
MNSPSALFNTLTSESHISDTVQVKLYGLTASEIQFFLAISQKKCYNEKLGRVKRGVPVMNTPFKGGISS